MSWDELITKYGLDYIKKMGTVIDIVSSDKFEEFIKDLEKAQKEEK